MLAFYYLITAKSMTVREAVRPRSALTACV
jgi:hypothetical protein